MSHAPKERVIWVLVRRSDGTKFEEPERKSGNDPKRRPARDRRQIAEVA